MYLSSSLKPQVPKLYVRIFSMQQYYMMFYIDPDNDAPGVQNSPTTGAFSSHIHVFTMGKAYKNLFSQKP